MLLNIQNGLTRWPTWFVIADRSQLRIFEKSNRHADYSLVKKWRNAGARKKAKDLLSDRAGRGFESFSKSRRGQTGPARYALSGVDLDKKAIDTCVSHIVKVLEKADLKKQFKKLVLIAEPQILGRVQKNLNDGIHKKLLSTLKKDYAQIKDAQVTRKLDLLLEGRPHENSVI